MEINKVIKLRYDYYNAHEKHDSPMQEQVTLKLRQLVAMTIRSEFPVSQFCIDETLTWNLVENNTVYYDSKKQEESPEGRGDHGRLSKLKYRQAEGAGIASTHCWSLRGSHGPSPS